MYNFKEFRDKVKEAEKLYNLNSAWKDPKWWEKRVRQGRTTREMSMMYIALGMKVEEIAQQVYPDLFDIQILLAPYQIPEVERDVPYHQRHTSRQHDYSYTISLIVVVKFPETKITNSYKNEAEIKDLFIRTVFSYYSYSEDQTSISPRPYITMSYAEGTRTSCTIDEYVSGYKHSHISGDYRSIGYEAFCLGDGEIINTIGTINDKLVDGTFFGDMFMMYLYQLEVVAGWESLEGTPYRNIINIGFTNNLVDKQRFYQDEVEIVARKIIAAKRNKLNWVRLGNTFQVKDDDALESFCRWKGDNFASYEREWLTTKDSAGNYYVFSKKYADGITIPSDTVIFRGEELTLKVEGEIPEEKKRFYIHPQFKEHVKSILNGKLKMGQARISVIKRLSQDNNIRTIPG